MSKHKEAICEVLKKSGPLQGSFLKERVLAFLNLEDKDYPKSTYLNHLVQLVDEFKIQFEVIDNKRVYSYKNFEHNVPGGLIIENLGGRIHIPSVLKAFHPKISQGASALDYKNEIHFYFEFNSTNICLSIHKDSIPIKLHISRFTKSSQIYGEIIELFGTRTITLELPINKISSFKNEEKSGQILIEINELNEVKINNLKATNDSSVLTIENLTVDSFFNNISQSRMQTIHNDWLDEKHTTKKEIKITKSIICCRPAIIKLSTESILLIN